MSYGLDVHRSLPQAYEAEKGVLCSFLLAPREIGQMCAEKRVTKDVFHSPANAIIFDTLLEFWLQNEPIDFVTITQWMRDQGTLDLAGGGAYITDLFTFLPTAANAAYYIEIVLEKYTLRELIKVCTEHAAKGYDEQDDVPRLLESAQVGLLKVVQLAEGQRLHSRTTRELINRFFDRLNKRMTGDWKIEMPTGIKALDKATMGFSPNTVTMLLGLPSDGKSSLALNIAEHLAIDCGKRVGIISMDDSDDQVMDRLVQSRARVDLWRFKLTGKFEGDDLDLIHLATQEIDAAGDRLRIRDDGALTPGEISATLTAWKAKGGLDFAIIDHIQLAQSDKKTDSRTSAAEDVSRNLKPMAKRLEIPLFVLSQVSEGTDGSYATKNTKALGEDANNLWRIRRTKDTTDAFIHIGKQKDGPRNVNVPVKYEECYTRFSDRAHQPEAEQTELVNMPPQKRNRR